MKNKIYLCILLTIFILLTACNNIDYINEIEETMKQNDGVIEIEDDIENHANEEESLDYTSVEDDMEYYINEEDIMIMEQFNRIMEMGKTGVVDLRKFDAELNMTYLNFIFKALHLDEFSYSNVISWQDFILQESYAGFDVIDIHIRPWIGSMTINLDGAEVGMSFRLSQTEAINQMHESILFGSSAPFLNWSYVDIGDFSLVWTHDAQFIRNNVLVHVRNRHQANNAIDIAREIDQQILTLLTTP